MCVLWQTLSDLLTTEDVGVREERQFSASFCESSKQPLNQIRETNIKQWKNLGLLHLRCKMDEES